jgi:diguanylate cyclase (GGDEF)-like protein
MAGDPFRYLDANLLRELHAVVVAARCPPKTLLSGIDARFVASLEEHASEAADLLATLHRLNETRHLTDGEVPFELWLGNASTLWGHLPDAAAVVERALGEVRRQRAVSEEPTSLVPSSARAHVPLVPASTHASSGDSYLVIIRHPDATRVGERWVLEQALTRIGRGGKDVDWALTDNEISRQQCHVERRGDRWILCDLSSTNGTWVNEDRLDAKAERELNAGDRIRFGNVILRFFGGKEAVPDRSRTLFHSGPADRLTGLASRARILDALGTARRDGRGWVTVLAIYVDQMDRIDDDESEPIGNYVLQELARVLESALQPRDLVGRLEGRAFLMVLPDQNGEGMASRVLSAVRSHAWCVEGERLQVTVSIGLATDLKGARLAATTALQQGGNDIVIKDIAICEGPRFQANTWRTPHSRVSVYTLIKDNNLLAAFSITDEEAVIRLGQETIDLWETQLSHLIRSCFDRSEHFKGHVFAALDGYKASEVGRILYQVQTKWASLPVPLLHQRILARSLRCATLSPEEVREYGRRSFNILLERIQQQSKGFLPFPLEALRPIALTHPSEYVRAKTLCDAIDAALRFITAVELAALRDVDDATVREKVAAILAEHRTGQPLTMAAWCALAGKLAQLAMGYLRGPIKEAAIALAPSISYNQRLKEATTRSARYLSHAPPQHESSHAQDRAFFEAVLDELAEEMDPFTRLRLVSVAGIDGYDEDEGTTTYQLYLHQGPSERFPLVQESLTAKLAKNDWCYLIGAPEQPALLLAPMVAARPCADCGKIEVFMADSLILGPKWAKVRVKGITTAHEAWVMSPSSAAGRLLYEAVMR